MDQENTGSIIRRDRNTMVRIYVLWIVQILFTSVLMMTLQADATFITDRSSQYHRRFHTVTFVGDTLRSDINIQRNTMSQRRMTVPESLKDHGDEMRPATTSNRRDVITSLLNAGCVLLYTSSEHDMAFAAATDTAQSGDNESFASIAERANKMSKEMDAINPQSQRRMASDSTLRPTNQTIYDFLLPITGTPTPLADIIRQEFNSKQVTIPSKNETVYYQDVKVKAIIVVNIKQDDPVARKAIPELIALAAKYGRGADYELAIIACPTDQGYYEPDTSQLLKLKLASEYGYGINPSTVVTDKVNLLGTGAVPLWRWLQNVCRTPSGLGRIQGNFEKFLIDGRSGLPLRRYPRKYRPINMMEDIEAVIAGKPLPPAQAGYLEEWRMAIADSERDTYRFEKGLNVFDQ